MECPQILRYHRAMPKTSAAHIKFGQQHTKWIELLMQRMGMDRSAIIKLALYRLAVEEGIVDPVRE